MHLETESGTGIDDPTAADIAAALGSLGPENGFAILSSGPGAFIQTSMQSAHEYCLEFRDPKDDKQYQVLNGVNHIHQVVQAFQRYAAGDGSWRKDFPWQLLDSPSPTRRVFKLTKAANPKELARFVHLKSAGLFRPKCTAQLPGDVYTCTRQQLHKGPHAAHSLFGTLVAIWDDSPQALVERFVQFGALTDDDLYRLSAWCGGVVLGFEGDVNYPAAKQFFMPLTSMATNLLLIRNAQKGGTATYLLDQSMVAGIDLEFLGFIEALIRGQRDSVASLGRTEAAGVLTTVLEFVKAEITTRAT